MDFESDRIRIRPHLEIHIRIRLKQPDPDQKLWFIDTWDWFDIPKQGNMTHQVRTNKNLNYSHELPQDLLPGELRLLRQEPRGHHVKMPAKVQTKMYKKKLNKYIRQ